MRSAETARERPIARGASGQAGVLEIRLGRNEIVPVEVRPAEREVASDRLQQVAPAVPRRELDCLGSELRRLRQPAAHGLEQCQLADAVQVREVSVFGDCELEQLPRGGLSARSTSPRVSREVPRCDNAVVLSARRADWPAAADVVPCSSSSRERRSSSSMSPSIRAIAIRPTVSSDSAGGSAAVAASERRAPASSRSPRCTRSIASSTASVW